jgi:hypothetical protein
MFYRQMFLAAIATVSLLSAVGAAKADLLYDFSFSTANYSASGQIITDVSNDVLSVSGSVLPSTGLTAGTGGSITGLVSDRSNNVPPVQGTFYAPSGQGWYYNDVLYPSGPALVDNNGILFEFGAGNFGNIYTVGSTYYFSVDNPGVLYNPGDVITAGGITFDSEIAAVPEPSTWAMMMFGFAGVGFMAYRRKVKPTSMMA